MDLKRLQDEVQQARVARLDAVSAGDEVEELIRQVQHFQPGRQRVVFSIEGWSAETETPHG
jgi:hypothetical protein